MDTDDLQQHLATADEWPVEHVALGVTNADGTLATHGPTSQRFFLASVTKPLTAVGTLLAVQLGDLHLDEPAGPDGSTVRHLLAHASGLGATVDAPRQEPGTRRLYSNAAFDLLGELAAERVGESFADHCAHELFDELDMRATSLDGSPAREATSTVDDLLAFARELLRPELLDPDLAAELGREQFPGLDGVVPGYGRQVPCPWGLGVEIAGSKSPHWTGPSQPPSVFGHFGRTGTFLWIDRAHDVAAVALTDRDFGPWAAERWAPFNDRIAHLAGAAVAA